MPKETVFIAAVALAALASAPAEAGANKYFLTVDATDGSSVLNACGKGYHMASLWEILDLAQLKYDTKRGYEIGDSGSGPPVNTYGWVRTGHSSSAINIPGSGNCYAWTSGLGNEWGSAVALVGEWAAGPVLIQPWSPITPTCDSPLRVWCRQN